jgi:hypothetical protein
MEPEAKPTLTELEKAFVALRAAATELSAASTALHDAQTGLVRARARTNAAETAYEAARWGANVIFDPQFNLLGHMYPNPPEVRKSRADGD